MCASEECHRELVSRNIRRFQSMRQRLDEIAAVQRGWTGKRGT